MSYRIQDLPPIFNFRGHDFIVDYAEGVNQATGADVRRYIVLDDEADLDEVPLFIWLDAERGVHADTRRQATEYGIAE